MKKLFFTLFFAALLSFCCQESEPVMIGVNENGDTVKTVNPRFAEKQQAKKKWRQVTIIEGGDTVFVKTPAPDTLTIK